MSVPAEVFEPVRSALESAGVAYAIGGSWASGAFGEPRMTKDIDVIADFTLESLDRFMAALPCDYHVDPEYAHLCLRLGRSFNAISISKAYKIDFFPVRATPLGVEQLRRAAPIANSQLSAEPVPFVSPEDILLAKLHWYQSGGGVSDQQWRDVSGIVNACRSKLDLPYLRAGAATLGVTALLDRALEERR